MSKPKNFTQLGKDVRKIAPKLRMIANGKTEVNVVRAERCSSIAVSSRATRLPQPLSMSLVSDGAPRKALPPRGTISTPSSDVLANVFITTTTDAHLPTAQVRETARVGNLATATVRLSDLKRIAEDGRVRHISLAQGLSNPNPVRSQVATIAPTPSKREIGRDTLHKYGQGVLVGIIDVEGFDFAHSDFLGSNGTTRFHSIWDQGAANDGTAPGNRGRVIAAKQMNEAIAASSSVGAPAVELEPQSRRVPSSHGTHVTSIAAGNSGVARNATIAAVLISLGAEDSDPRLSFYDTTQLAHAIDHLFELGRQLKMPVSINVSLGTNGHAHDASAPINRWIDAWLVEHGRAICVAAGNAGQDRATRPDDLGWVMGRIHTSGQISAAGLEFDVDWVVAGRGGRDYSENELELWFSAQDKIAVSLRTPAGQWIGPVEPRQFIENKRLLDGSFVSIYNELYDPANGANSISLYLSPNLTAKPIVGVESGQWTVRLHSREIRDGRFDGWIERDDPHPLPPSPGVPEPLAFPSFFSERTNVDRSSISTLACASGVVAVANLDSTAERINITSSQGPTRDGRFKPDIAAPGTNIVAACGFDEADKRWVSMSGTSMASPYVCGVIALMLATQADLSAAQVNAILQRTAKPLPGNSFAWQSDSGYGVIDPEACVLEAFHVNDREDKTK